MTLPTTTDEFYAEAALSSEQWAVEDLGRKLYGVEYDGFVPIDRYPEIVAQLADERRHVDVLWDWFNRRGVRPCRTPMQNIIYHGLGSLDLAYPADFDTFCFFHQVTERRAMVIYATYLRGGRDDELKKIFRDIMADERGHIHPCRPTNGAMRAAVEVDKWAFEDFIPRTYGRNLLAADCGFWDWYRGPEEYLTKL